MGEHEDIVAALGKLVTAAKVEEVFAEKLMFHARTEERLLYPAAILVGPYLKLVSEDSSTAQTFHQQSS